MISAVTSDTRVPPAVAAVAIGSALAAAILISGPISGAGVNPASAIGPMILTGRFPDWWAYLIAPVLGGTLAVATYQRLVPKESTRGVPRSAAEARESASTATNRPAM